MRNFIIGLISVFFTTMAHGLTMEAERQYGMPKAGRSVLIILYRY